MKRKEKYRLRIFIQPLARNNAVVVKPQEQRKCDLALACNCNVFELDTLIVMVINGVNENKGKGKKQSDRALFHC